ncbi:hypothetical protein KC19_VG248800 [Ceratodon purpureus]|uniref:Uncharacterized protein n=1 Tax=Ceratodon purpureus TaxID=3225 RepID=A0A8T0HTZ9_CERPU|nr:hypothetical protein KC19_VG248800 [Ceratodon purpureus]
MLKKACPGKTRETTFMEGGGEERMANQSLHQTDKSDSVAGEKFKEKELAPQMSREARPKLHPPHRVLELGLAAATMRLHYRTEESAAGVNQVPSTYGTLRLQWIVLRLGNLVYFRVHSM